MGVQPVVGQGEDSSPKLWSNVMGVNSEPVVWSRLSICWNVDCKSLLLFSPDLQTSPLHHLLPEHLYGAFSVLLPLPAFPWSTSALFWGFPSDPGVPQQGEVIATLTALLGNSNHCLRGFVVHNCTVGRWGDCRETLTYSLVRRCQAERSVCSMHRILEALISPGGNRVW